MVPRGSVHSVRSAGERSDPPGDHGAGAVERRAARARAARSERRAGKIGSHLSGMSTATARGEERVWDDDLEVAAPHYGIDDVPPPWETLLYAWQHTLVDVSPYVLPI